MTDSRVAKRYARALFNIAQKQDIVQAVDDDLTAVTTAFRQSENFRTFMKSPQTTDEQKLALLDKVFSDRITALTMQVLRLLVEKNRDAEVFGLQLEFSELRRRAGGVVKAEVISAISLDDVQQNHIVAKVMDLTGRQVEAEFSVDPKLIGGVKVFYDNNVLDGSAQGALTRFREHLLYDVLKQA